MCRVWDWAWVGYRCPVATPLAAHVWGSLAAHLFQDSETSAFPSIKPVSSSSTLHPSIPQQASRRCCGNPRHTTSETTPFSVSTTLEVLSASSLYAVPAIFRGLCPLYTTPMGKGTGWPFGSFSSVKQGESRYTHLHLQGVLLRNEEMLAQAQSMTAARPHQLTRG